MNEKKGSQKKVDYKALIGNALVKIESLESQLKTIENQKKEPIAIIGMSCRFPGGANSPEGFWEVLSQGVDAITEVPEDRWDVNDYYDPNDEPGTILTPYGGFISEVDKFDAGFFGISPRESNCLDPQQRLLLEVGWEAIERANINPDNLLDSNTGVFIGICTNDYLQEQITTFTTPEPYLGTGNAVSAGPGRLSYLLGLTGPCLALSTACSSSLVSVHLACQSLRNRESDLALAGGVNLLLSPFLTTIFLRAKMLSPDGRCKTFDAEANGYVRSEGCGMMVLKRLSDAVADGDNILAVIRGSAINQDGASGGLTVPNGPSQQAVIRQALESGGVDPARVSYIEAHGTGTSLGDPIEVGAIGRVFGKTHSQEQPLIIGSAKSNIGHSEGAAGIASLIKVVLQLQHQKIAPSLHFNQPNPHIDWDKSPVQVATKLSPWSTNGNSRIAGVSSFGFSGINAHIVLEEAPTEVRSQKSEVRSGELERPVHMLALSAKTQKALEDLVSSYQSYLESNPDDSVADVCYTASTSRAHFNHRLGLIASEPKELIEKLQGWKNKEELVGVFSGQHYGSEGPKIAFLFTGQGSQYVNMAWQLYELAPTFRKAVEECDQILQQYLEESILEIIYPQDAQKSSDLLDQTAYTQPAIFVIEYALFKLWSSWGIKPSVVMGHSVGEYVAATVAGVFSLEDGLKLIAMRGKLMQKLPSGGEMVSIMASESQVTEAIGEYSSRVTIAAVNGPESIVISGESGAIATICSFFESVGVKTKKLQVSHAFHSPLMEPMLTEFEAVAKEITYNQPRITLISNVTGTEAGAEITTAQYWVAHVRQPVRFAQSMKTLEEEEYEVFLEIGPKPILLSMGRQCVKEDVGEWLPSLRPGVDEWQQMLSSLGKLYVKGAKIDWSGFDSDYSRQKVALPTYPFQRERYWIQAAQAIDKKRRKTQSSDSQNQTPTFQLLSEGNTETLTQQLETAAQLSPEKVKLLPEILEVLAKQHQEQLTASSIKNWFYEIEWKPSTQTNSNTKIEPSHWLILADSTGFAEKLAQKLQQQGHEYSLVYRGESYEKQTAASYQLNPNLPEDFEKLYQEIPCDKPMTRLIHLWSLDAPESGELNVDTLEESQLWGCGSVVNLLQTVVKNSSTAKVWLVTRGSQSVLSKENNITGLANSSLWGLGRVVSIEHPQLWGGLVDLDPEATAADEVEMLWQLLANQQLEEDNLALRGEKTYTARLANQKPPKSPQTLSLSSEGSYLITGGLGALGLQTAQLLVQKGAKNIVLTGRRSPTEDQSESLKTLEETGCLVQVMLGDVSVEVDIAKILETIETSMPTLKGIIHAAGVLDDGTIQQMNWERLAKVMSPKVKGTWNLHKFTQNLALDFFVCFSSIASIFGSPGQGNYAAANAFMDSLASYRRSKGLSGLAINWGTWASGGMAASLSAENKNRIQKSGISEISPKEGMYALDLLLANQSSTAQVGVVGVDWSVVAENLSGVKKTSLLRELLQKWDELETGKQKQKVKAEFFTKLEGVSKEKRQEILTEHIRGQVAQVLGLSSSQLPEVNVGFMSMGMDSLMTVELKNRLQNQLGTNLPETIAIEYPTIAKLSLYVEELMGWKTAELEASSSNTTLEMIERSTSEAIAIIGIGCRFPQNANTPESFWELLSNGKDSITEIPLERWDLDDYYDPNPEAPGKMYIRNAALVEQVDQFDPQFFGISNREAHSLDPQQRFILEVTWEALERAGINAQELENTQTGVFLGIGQNDYANLGSKIEDISPYDATGNGFCFAAGRLSYFLGLQGPSIAIDTACSSSLVAIHQACQSLRQGESNLALAGGVQLILSPQVTTALSKLKALSPDGKCKTFDAAADGYGRGEGCGMVVLKRLSDALQDGDNICAVIRGSAVNHDGPSSGMTVPNKLAQEKLIQKALKAAKVEPDRVSYVEAHGTGTSLGDPMEVRALARVFEQGREKENPLNIASVKTNIGHLEAAAGIAGIIKVVLQLQHQEIAPHLHMTNPNPFIDWENMPLKVPTQLTPWLSSGEKRVAGVSSFGISGTNAHIVLEEAPTEVKSQKSKVKNGENKERPIQILTLSAKTEKALEDLVNSYQSYLETNPDLAVADICYTASTGRAHFKNHRLGVIASGAKELIEKLEGWKSQEELVGVFSGQANSESTQKIAFLFTGQGSQYVNMAKQLYEQAPTFRKAVEECDQILQQYLEESILEIIYPKDAQKSSDVLDQTGYTQPAIFVIEYALAKLWGSWGIKPNVVMGHSVGEYVAATVAGILSLEDGLKLIAMRGKLMQKLPSGGGMVSVMASESQGTEAIGEYSSQVTIAAVNGPESIVISGESAAIASICSSLESVGVKTKQLQVSHAFHSPLMEPMLTEFETVAKQVTYNQPKIRLISNVTGTEAGAEITTAEYWVGHVRQPVRFAQGMNSLHQQGYETFIEVGPKPILLSMGRQCVTEDVGEWLPSLRPGVDEWQQMLSSLGKLYVKGVKIDWSGFDSDYSRSKVGLPTYPFQRERFWVETKENKQEIHKNQDSQNQTPTFQLLTEGNTETLTKQLETAAKLSPEKVKLLPEILEVLAKQHQEELTAVSIKNWFYEIEWKPSLQINSNTKIEPSHWLILADSTGVAEKLAQKLEQQGHEYSLVYQGESYKKHKAGSYQLNPHAPEDFEKLYQEIQQEIESEKPITKLIHLWSIDAPTSEELTIETLESTQLWGCGSVVQLLQTLVKNSSTPEIWLVTRGCQSVLSKTENNITGLAGSPLWGLGRVVSIEHPQLWGGLVDLDPQAAANEVEMLWQLLANQQQQEDNLALRGEKTYVARLANQKPPKSPQTLSLSSEGSYLITGGLGALGLQTAQWLVQKGAKNIVLTGRRSPTEQVSESIKKLEETGCLVQVILGDVSVEEDIAKILETIETSMPKLKGIIHAAGVLDDGTIQQMNWERFTKVMSPKVKGTWNLHKFTQNLPLDFFVCFSSIASIFGSPGQGNYAAANAFMDSLASYRRSKGLSGLAINWGAWASGGMAARLATENKNRMQRSGISEISPKEGMYALDLLLANQSTASQVGVVGVDWSVVAENSTGVKKNSLLREFLQWEEEDTGKQKVKAEFLTKLEETSLEKRQEILTEYIQGQVAQVLGLSSSQLPEVNVGFMEMGMDSLMTVELKNRLQNQLETNLPETIAIEYPTIAKLSLYVEELMGWKTTQTELDPLSALSEETQLEMIERLKSEAIAIIGIGCRFPQNANTPESFWELLSNGKDSITEIPRERWDLDYHYDPNPEAPGKMYIRNAALVDEVDQFDPQFFGISDREANHLDPQQRFILEVTWEALERAGINPQELENSQTGVFLGICQNDYANVDRLVTDVSPYDATGNGFSFVAGRLSYFLGLQGPSIAIDTACSSSLVAIHEACQSLRQGESNLALAGGVQLILSPQVTTALSKLKALSPDGKCKTFDAAADGYGRGEGCGMVVLKRLSDALKDGDRISAVIRGSAVNHDGPSSGMTVPNKLAQEKLINKALKAAKLEPSQVSYVEAHGTGTSLGDPMEVRALARVFEQGRTHENPLNIASVKTNIGHLEAAAGIAGIIKVVLQLQHQEIAPHLHLVNPNPYIDWENIPLKIPTQLTPWLSSGEKRVAGVSSFGINGTNSHIVLEEAPNEVRSKNSEVKNEDNQERPIQILTLSAKTEKALEDLVGSYQSYLESNPDDSVADVCYSASTGRAHFKNHRLGVIASERKELIEKLQGWKNKEELVGVFSGQANYGRESSKIAFLFTGQGSQYVNMAWQLYEQSPTFRKAVEECDQILQQYLEESILEIIYPKDAQKSTASLLDQTGYTQPAIFVIEYALFKLWTSWGIKPNVVMGHSVGEYVAACISGIFSLEDGLKLIAMRGKLMQKLPSGGEMVSVMASESQVTEVIKEYNSKVTIAAINGPESIVISGESAAIGSICSQLESVGVKTKKLQVSHAFHSPLMEPMLTEFEAVAKQVTYNQPKIRLISNVTGIEAGEEVTTAQYWVGHVCQPVRFAQSMKTLESEGYDTFLEIGPKPILLSMGRQCVTEDVGEWLPSLRPGVDEWEQMLSSLGKLYAKGAKIDWSGFDSDYSRSKVGLPTYPFQRERYWIQTTDKKQKIENLNQTPIVKLLTEGNTETLTKELETEFSPEKLKLLPEILEVLAKKHQEQLTASSIKNWFYEIEWKPSLQTNSNTNIEPIHWLILADSTGVAEKLAQKLQQQGHEYSLVYRAESYEKQTGGTYQLNPQNPEEFEKLYQEIQESSETPMTRLIHLWSLDAPESGELTVETLESTQSWGCGSVVQLLQTLVKNSSIAKVWLVTRGSQSVLSKTENNITGLANSPLWGLGRVMSLEHPKLWGGLVDLDPEAPAAEEVEMLWQLLVNEKFEDNLALRGEKTYVARLIKQDSPKFSQPLSLSSEGSYLITGGLGALGLQTAQWLVSKGAKNIVLTGRRPPKEKVSESIKKLEERGCQVKVMLGDVCVEEDIAKILETIQTSLPTLKGIIHAAGVSGEGELLHELELSRLKAVLRPKVVGGWLLHKLTQKLKLDFFVNFSSIAAVWGSKGQGHYAAANHFLDGLSYYRQSVGLPSYSINWGPWSGGGMATGEAIDLLNKMGVKPLKSEKAIAALEKVLVSNSPQTVVADMNWRLFKDVYELEGKRSFLEEISVDSEAIDTEVAEEEETRKQKVKAEFLAKLEKETSNEKRQEMLTEQIQGQVAQVLGLSTSKLPEVNLGFVSMGMDSLMAVELRNQLQKMLNCSLPTTLTFEFPNIVSLADYISSKVLGWEKTIEEPKSNVEAEKQKAQEIIEIENLAEEDVESSIIQELADLNTLLEEN